MSAHHMIFFAIQNAFLVFIVKIKGDLMGESHLLVFGNYVNKKLINSKFYYFAPKIPNKRLEGAIIADIIF